MRRAFPRRPMVPGGLGLPGEGGDEHPVAPVPMGPQSNPGRSAVGAVDLRRAPGRADGGRSHRPRRRFRRSGTCTPSRRVGLPASADRRARRVIATWVRASLLSSSLRLRHNSSGRRRADPMPEHGASTMMRSKEPAQRWMLGILGQDERRAAPSRVAALRIRAPARAGCRRPRPDRRHPRAARRVDASCRRVRRTRRARGRPVADRGPSNDERRGLVLDGEPPVGESGERRRDRRRPRAGTWGRAAMVAVRARLRCKASVNPSTETMSVFARSDSGALPGERPSGRLDLLAGQQPRQLLDDPRRQPGAHRDLGSRPAPSGHGGGSDAELAQHGVDEPALAVAREADRLPHRGMRGDVGEQHLVGAEAQHVARTGAHARHRPGGDTVQRPVDRAQVPDRAEREIGGDTRDHARPGASVEAPRARRSWSRHPRPRPGGSPRAPPSVRSASPELLPRVRSRAPRRAQPRHRPCAPCPAGTTSRSRTAVPPRVSTTGIPSWAICNRPGPRIDAEHGTPWSGRLGPHDLQRPPGRWWSHPGAGASARTRRRSLRRHRPSSRGRVPRGSSFGRDRRRQPHPAEPHRAVPPSERPERLDHEWRAEAGEPLAERAGVVGRPDRNLSLRARRARCPGLRPASSRHAGGRVTFEDRPLHRARAPPSRQQREVQVEAPE